MNALRPRVTALLLAWAIGLSGPAAFGQSKEDLAKARALFREGVALSAANNWAGALAKFKEVAQVKMTPQVAFNIAECEEHLGKLSSALGNYRLAASEAMNPDAKAAEVANQVGGRIAALEARIPKLTIKRGEGAETATILLDDTELGSSQLGSPIPVDPGPHVVIAKINGKEASRDTVKLDEKQSKTVNVVIDLEQFQAQGGQPATGDQPPTTGPGPDKAAEGGSKVPGIVVTSIGGASLVAGVVFIILRQGAISDLDAMCGGDETCPPGAESTADSGKLYTGLAQITIPLGVVGVVAGAVMIATSGSGKEATPPASGSKPSLRFVGAAPGATIGGASLMGRF